MVTLSYPYFIEIPKASQTCSLGLEPLAGSDYYSALFENDEAGCLDRKDFCLTCWKTFSKDEAFSKAKSFWKSRMPEKSPEKPPKNRQEHVFNSLENLLKQDSEESRRLAYMLTLFLARQRLLILRQEVELDGYKCGLYEIAQQGVMLCVKKVNLQELTNPDLQIKVAALIASS